MTMEQMLAQIDKRTSDYSTELAAHRAAMDKKLVEIDGRLKSTDDTLAEFRKGSVSLPGSNVNGDKVDGLIFKALYGIATQDWRFPDGGKVHEIIKQTADKFWNSEQGRAMSTIVGSAGGFVVPTEYLTDFIELAKAESVMFAAGVRSLTGLTGSPVVVNKQTGATTMYEVAENDTITASAPTLGQTSMSPKIAGGIVEMSRLSALLSNPSLQSLAEQDLAQEIALIVDKRCQIGTGSSNQPLGIVNLSGVGSVAIGTNGGDLVYDHLIDLEGDVEDAYLLKGSCAFMFHGKLRRKLFKQIGADGRPLYQREPDASGKMAKTLIGYPYHVGMQLPTNLTKGTGTSLTYCIFGNFADAYIGQWGNLVLEASTQAGNYFAKHQLGVKAVMAYDFLVRHDASFSVCSDAKTT